MIRNNEVDIDAEVAALKYLTRNSDANGAIDKFLTQLDLLYKVNPKKAGRFLSEKLSREVKYYIYDYLKPEEYEDFLEYMYPIMNVSLDEDVLEMVEDIIVKNYNKKTK